MTMTVDVFHNVSTDPMRYLQGYTDGDPLVKVATVTVPDSITEVSSACEWVFRLLNVGDDPAFGTPDPQALDYRRRRNRSLSVGDVLLFDGAGFTCANAGWAACRVKPEQIVTRSQHGTTPVEA